MAHIEAKDLQYVLSHYAMPSNLSEGDAPMDGSDRNSERQKIAIETCMENASMQKIS